MKNAFLFALTVLACGWLTAQEYGDAPPSYGDLECWQGYYPGICGRLGATCSNEAAPKTPFWTGDNDDGIVGIPHFDSWSNQNTLTVDMQDWVGYLVCWVDANDNGSFENTPEERYIYSQAELMPGQYTFTGITLRATQDFSRAGHNKVAVRICCQENVGGGVMGDANGYFYYGEIEDWLIDVDPAKPAVTQFTVAEAIEGAAYSQTITASNFSGTPTWSMTAGTLPAGVSLAQVGNDYVLSGTPGSGTGSGLQYYSFTVRATFGSQSATRDLILQVWPPAFTAPFADDFATAKGWELKGTWARGQAQAFTGSGANFLNLVATDPGHDATPTSDNCHLQSSPQAETPDLLPKTEWVCSPYIDCSNLSAVTVRFKRWISYGDWDHTKIQVSHDGVNWTDIWAPLKYSGTPIAYPAVADAGWKLMEYDISAVAANRPMVQVRFGMGWVNSAYRATWGGDGFCGFSVDDFWIGASPSASADAQNFNINSPVTFTAPGFTAPLPVCYVGSNYGVSVTVNNTDSEAIVIDRVEVGVSFPAPYGSSGLYVFLHAANDGWFDCGSWSFPTLGTVNAGGSMQLAGNFSFTGISIGAMQPFKAEVVIFGHTTTSNRGAVVKTSTHFCPYPGAMPGLHVWEAPAGSPGTTEIANGEPAANLRDFGSMVVNGTTSNIYIICKSTTSNPFTVNAPMLTGDVNDFTVYTPSPWNPTPHQGQNDVWFTIRFTPKSAGAKSCWVSITHTASNTATPFTFEVKGIGMANAPVLTVLEGGAMGAQIANGSMAVGALNFGQVDISAGPAGPVTIYIENNGNQLLNLGAPAFTSGAGNFYLDTSSLSLGVAPGSSTSFDVYFDPSQVGVQDVQIEFAHNDTGTSTPFTFRVAGEGIIALAVMEVLEGVSPQSVLLSGAPATGRRAFGLQLVSAGPTAPLHIEIRNNGWVPLNLGTPTLSGLNSADFVLDLSLFTTTVAPQSSTSFEVAFDPLGKGPKSATVSFTHDDLAVANPFTFDVSGFGDDPNGVVINSKSMPLGQAAVAYSQFVSVSGGTAPFSFTQTGGVLPAGLTLASDGNLRGLPSQAGMFTFRVKVTDALGGTDERLVNITIQPALGSLSHSLNPTGGCVAGSAERGWLIGLLLLAVSVPAILRRRRA